jgi:hypothetical protein
VRARLTPSTAQPSALTGPGRGLHPSPRERLGDFPVRVLPAITKGVMRTQGRPPQPTPAWSTLRAWAAFPLTCELTFLTLLNRTSKLRPCEKFSEPVLDGGLAPLGGRK